MIKNNVSRETRWLMYCIYAFLFLLGVNNNVAQDDIKEKPLVVAISQIIEHPALDDVRKGVLDFLKEKGYEEGRNLVVIYRNAQGNIATSSQIAYALMAHDPLPDVFIAIGTPTAQSAISAGRKNKIPVIFAAVTDPISSKLVGDLNNHDPLITGVIDFPPLKDQLQLIKTFFPQIEKIGVVYNSGESNAVSTVEALKIITKEEGIQVIDGVISKATDLTLVFRHLHAEGVKAIYVPQDNTVISAAAMVAQLSYATKIPVFTSDSGSVKQGAFASQSYSYYDVGKKTGDYALQIFKGKQPSDLPIEPPQHHALYFNVDTAKQLGLTIPSFLLSKAHLYPKRKKINMTKADHNNVDGSVN